MIKIDDAIEFLEALADELAGSGDRINADNLTEVIKILDERKELDVIQRVEPEGDRSRCPRCLKFVPSNMGRCWWCGQRYSK